MGSQHAKTTIFSAGLIILDNTNNFYVFFLAL